MPLFSLRLNRALANHLWIKLYSSFSIFDTDSMAWLILGDLNELSSLDEKVLLVEETPQGTIILKVF